MAEASSKNLCLLMLSMYESRPLRESNRNPKRRQLLSAIHIAANIEFDHECIGFTRKDAQTKPTIGGESNRRAQLRQGKPAWPARTVQQIFLHLVACEYER